MLWPVCDQTVRDSVKLHALVLKAIGAGEVFSVIGGSMGAPHNSFSTRNPPPYEHSSI